MGVTDPALAKMSLGFELCGIAMFVWASIDYNRFIKFWMLRPGPYTRRVTSAFRLFFLVCVVGAVWQLAETIAGSHQAASFYLGALLLGVAWLAAVFAMIHTVEWMNRKRRTK